MNIIAIRDYNWNVKNSIEEFKSGISYDVPDELAEAMVSVRYATMKKKKITKKRSKVTVKNKSLKIKLDNK